MDKDAIDIVPELSSPLSNLESFDVSIICIYTRKELLDEMLSSCSQSRLRVELVLIDNTEGEWSCAADALNYGVKHSHAPIVVALHQDIEFLSKDALERLVSFVANGELAVYGIAGVDVHARSRRLISSMWELPDHPRKYSSLKTPMARVVDLDECLIAFKRDLFQRVSFDRETCPGWHLYVVDLCLQCNKIGIPSFVVDVPVWHKSGGKVDIEFYKSCRRLAKKYRRKFPQISTTCVWFHTDPLIFLAHYIRWLIQYASKRKSS